MQTMRFSHNTQPFTWTLYIDDYECDKTPHNTQLDKLRDYVWALQRQKAERVANYDARANPGALCDSGWPFAFCAIIVGTVAPDFGKSRLTPTTSVKWNNILELSPGGVTGLLCGKSCVWSKFSEVLKILCVYLFVGNFKIDEIAY